MKKLLIAGICGFVLVAACKKKITPLTPTDDPYSGEFTYDITGLRDTSMERTGEVRYVIFVERKTGAGEKVVLSAENVPDGMKVTFTPANEDVASYYTTMVLETERTKTGTYAINVKGASATSGIQNHLVNVKVIPYSNASTGLVGTYTETGNCSQTGSISNNITITSENTQDRIRIKGVFSGVSSNDIYADLNPDTKTLNIPKQTVNSVEYEGDGSYDDDKVIINYTITGVTINESCTSTLNRK